MSEDYFKKITSYKNLNNYTDSESLTYAEKQQLKNLIAKEVENLEIKTVSELRNVLEKHKIPVQTYFDRNNYFEAAGLGRKLVTLFEERMWADKEYQRQQDETDKDD